MKKLKEIIRENIIFLPFLGLLVAANFMRLPEYPEIYVSPRDINFRTENEDIFMRYKGIEYLLQKNPDSKEIILKKISYDCPEYERKLSKSSYKNN